MGIKRKLKSWIRTKLKKILVERTPVLIVTNNLIDVGNSTYHNGNFLVRGSGCKARLGSYCAIGKDVKLILNNHLTDYVSMQYSFYKSNFNSLPYVSQKPTISIDIGSDVWIGDNVIILPNVSIGHGCIIGAGSVVTKSFKPYTVIAGVPAKKIKMRFNNQVVEELLASKWWDWNEAKIKENKMFFFKKLNN